MDLWGNEDEDEYRARKRAEIFSSSYHFENYGMLENAIHRCRLCPLCDEGGRGPVLSTGPVDAPLMIVGEGPGGVEDEYGGPLVGPSGQLLDKALLSVGITRDHVYVTNIVKCRPGETARLLLQREMNAADGGWRKKYASCSRKLSSLSEKWRSVSFWGMMRVLSVPAAIGLITRASPSCRLSIRHTCSAERERD